MLSTLLLIRIIKYYEHNLSPFLEFDIIFIIKLNDITILIEIGVHLLTMLVVTSSIIKIEMKATSSTTALTKEAIKKVFALKVPELTEMMISPSLLHIFLSLLLSNTFRSILIVYFSCLLITKDVVSICNYHEILFSLLFFLLILKFIGMVLCR